MNGKEILVKILPELLAMLTSEYSFSEKANLIVFLNLM